MRDPMYLERATYRVLHSLRRKAAGEHQVADAVIIRAFMGEWMLSESEQMELVESVAAQAREIARRARS